MPPCWRVSAPHCANPTIRIEYLLGKPVIHHGRQYRVMTNSPVYSEQLKLNAFWSTKARAHELPGSIQSPDRFVRAIRIEGHEALQGNVTRQLQPAEPIQFLATR
jgi:penicillin V acylase-like amidase (Ntn superfamily)